MQICSDSRIRIPLHGATVIHNSIQNFSLSWTIIFDLLMTWLSCLNHLQNAFCLFLLIILYFSISFLIDHEGMSALDDKMTHLKQDMTFYKITKIVGALWLAERSVCMRVCKHGCGVNMFCFSRANHASANLKKFFEFKTRQVFFIYPFLRRLKLGKSLQRRCVIFATLKLTF